MTRVSGKRGERRPLVTFENSVDVTGGHEKNTRMYEGGC